MFWTILRQDVSNQEEVSIEGAKGHHLGRVLRVRTGEHGVVVSAGRRYDVEVIEAHGERVRARVLSEQAMEDPPVAITLLQAVLPNPDFDAVVEGVTAIGVSALVAVQAARSVRHPGVDRRARWEAIAESATEQSHGIRIPDITGPLPLPAALPIVGARLLALQPGAARSLSQAIEPGRPHALAIGPEGGWTVDELDQLEAAGGVCVSLGPRILRARLAPLVAAAILVHQS